MMLPQQSAGQYSRIRHNGRDVFLNGTNIAWVNFARDIGPEATDVSVFTLMLDSVQASGGNSMRFWLHTNGASTPAFDTAGMVSGPGDHTITGLARILDLAWERGVGLILCLWSFDMLRLSYGPEITGRARLMLTDTQHLEAYIDRSLVPMVAALRGHPGILAWEVFNEAEGMSVEYGWPFTNHVPMKDIQRFVNRVAGAIHRTDPSAKVTTGAWSFLAQSDQDFIAGAGLAHAGTGNYNFYDDERLVAAGGDRDGRLDFYSVHYFEWAGTMLSPFHHPASAWGLQKPVVVAEFPLNDMYGLSYESMYRTLYAGGYAGAMSWQWYDNAAAQARTKEVMRDLFARYPSEIMLRPSTGTELQASSTHPPRPGLLENYPNPFNPSTTISYSLAGRSLVHLAVYDMPGRQVALLAEGPQDAGSHRVTFDGASLASGVYLCRLTARPDSGPDAVMTASRLLVLLR